MPVMRIQSGAGAYGVDFEAALADIGGRLPTGPRVWVVDARVWDLYRQPLGDLAGADEVIPVPIHEDRKNLETAQDLCAALMDKGLRRRTCLVAVGGGILQDLAGFAASILFRGVPWAFVPTTLLAQADSCIGGKTSLNFRAFKNLLGTFWPPRQVVICPAFLGTLDAPDYFSGLGEVVKLHLMGGPETLAAFEADQGALDVRDPAALGRAIRTSLEVKKRFIELDEHDAGPRLLLNYGHCFGHALEAASGFRIPHGQAVVAGMRLANRISLLRGLLDPDLAQRVDRLLCATLTVPPTAAELAPGPILEAMGRDKKRTGAGLALIVLERGLAFAQIQDLTPEEARAALAAEGAHG